MPVAQLTAEEQGELLTTAERKLAQRSLEAFSAYMDPGYMFAAHTKLVIEHLEALERREIRNLRFLCRRDTARPTIAPSASRRGASAAIRSSIAWSLAITKTLRTWLAGASATLLWT